MANKKWTERVREYELTPADNSWQEIEPKLPPKKKNRFLFGWWMLLFLAFLSGIIFWQTDGLNPNSSSSEKTENQLKVQNKNVNNASQSDDIQFSIDSQNSDIKHANIPDKNRLNSGTGNTALSSNHSLNKDKYDNFSTHTKSIQQVNNSKKVVQKDAAKADETAFSESSRQNSNSTFASKNPVETNENLEENAVFSENHKISENRTLQNEPFSSSHDSLSAKDKNTLENKNLEDPISNKDSITSLTSKPAKSVYEKKSDQKYLMLIPFGNFIFTGSNLNYLEEFQESGAKQTSQLGYGIMLAFKFKNDKVRGYLGYDVSNYVFQSKNVFIDSLSQNSINQNILYNSDALMINDAGSGMQENLQTKLSYHSYTAGLDFLIKKYKKWQIRPYASFSVSSLKKQNVYITSMNNIELGEIHSLDKTVIKMNLGLGAEYKLFPSGTLFVMPNLEYYPTIFDRYSNSLYGFGMRFGFNFNF